MSPEFGSSMETMQKEAPESSSKKAIRQKLREQLIKTLGDITQVDKMLSDNEPVIKQFLKDKEMVIANADVTELDGVEEKLASNLAVDILSQTETVSSKTESKEKSPEEDVIKMAKKLIEKSLGNPIMVNAILGNEKLVTAYIKKNLEGNDVSEEKRIEVAAGLARFAVSNLKPEVQENLRIEPLKLQQLITENAREEKDNLKQ